ncbi:hypothetical protein Adt_40457 [Abeliophyllum distichum]|uniref:Uncharacterized protein n=1 Tax=Abeliophyllum distichum TaxID=126358 RepID=A0ABD1Q842_9LAMI
MLQNVPFFPSMGAQAVKKYFTPKWEEFSSHRDLEDVLEASLASVIRASALQMKVLGEFRTRIQEQRRLSAAASESDKEHKQALEGLQAALDSARMAYEQLEVDLKESDSNVLNLTKLLDNANAAQKVASEALEAANIEKRCLLDEVQCLRGNLDSSENSNKEAESNVARLLREKGRRRRWRKDWGTRRPSWRMQRQSLWRISTIPRPTPIFQITLTGLDSRRF